MILYHSSNFRNFVKILTQRHVSSSETSLFHSSTFCFPSLSLSLCLSFYSNFIWKDQEFYVHSFWRVVIIFVPHRFTSDGAPCRVDARAKLCVDENRKTGFAEWRSLHHWRRQISIFAGTCMRVNRARARAHVKCFSIQQRLPSGCLSWLLQGANIVRAHNYCRLITNNSHLPRGRFLMPR